MTERQEALMDAGMARRRRIGAAIRAARGHITQTQLAEALGVRQPTLSGWESGRFRLDLEKVLAIEVTLGLARGTLARLSGYTERSRQER